MLVRNVKFNSDNKIHSIYVNDEGMIECIDCNRKDGTVIDAKGRLISPPFVNPHSHLGYALTLKYAKFNESGTLLEGVQITREEIIPKISEEDLRKRLDIISKMLFINGVLYVRTHEPVLNDLAIKMLRIREEFTNLIRIQVVAFPTPGYFYGDNIERAEKALEEGAEVVGLIPHSEGSIEEGYKSIKIATDLAVKYGRLIDGHVDETDDPSSRFSEALAREALVRGIGKRTSISHMTASHSYDNWYFHKLLLLLRDSGVSVISNPVVSLHLQGRYDNYPKRRGIARIRELMKGGVNVALGSDNVIDAIYPLGDYNMLRVVQEAFLVDHFVASEVTSLISGITENGYKALSIVPPIIEEGQKAQFIILQARNYYDAIRTALPPFLVINGRYYANNNVSFLVNDSDITDKVINIVD
ncbi:amidohydrolase family protein [Stygiolobus caldivivus]|uniref:Amidohydrolase n=1 Tax=Stygiolobus caldivivus TaxID=2824673 RepID=A0A8D5U8J4_9CREN|nr:amidohydrolase family protein [Stygiolobus caldivivus]BCU71591.1 amidohydrolase [Stygiolobus caldivivus]